MANNAGVDFPNPSLTIGSKNITADVRDYRKHEDFRRQMRGDNFHHYHNTQCAIMRALCIRLGLPDDTRP